MSDVEQQEIVFDPYEFDDSGREGGSRNGSFGEVATTPAASLSVTDDDFDPYSFTQPKPAKKYKSAADKFRPSLVARARKRTVKQVAAGQWVIEGEERLGDSQGEYEVSYTSRKRVYDCDCYHTLHGESRKRSVCSHVLAVILWKEMNGGGHSGPVGESPTETEGHHTVINHDQREAVSTPVTGSAAVAEQLPLSPALENVRVSLHSEGSVTPVRDKPEVAEPNTSPLETVSTGQNNSLPQLPDTVPAVNDPRWGARPLPEKFAEIRPHQWDAVQETVEAFKSGSKVVWLDAPTGTGKTLVAELVRRELQDDAAYVCSSISLQEQFLRDFGYAKLLKGRSNYPTADFPFPDYTAADCTKTSEGDCLWCHEVSACPYEQAKSEALSSELSVLNTSYLLTEANYIGRFSGRALGIVDECDVLEKELMGFVEFNLSGSRLGRLKAEAPKKGSHKATLATWLDEDLKKALAYRLNVLGGRGDDVRAIRERQGLQRLYQETMRISAEMQNAISQGEEADIWVRDYPRGDADAFVLKPTKVDRYGPSMLWRHADKWLCMSATIISAQELADSLGLVDQFSVVRVPMTFDVENRKINVAPVADMANKHKPHNQEQMAKAIGRVLDRHPNERVLVHTVSYDLTRYLAHELRASHSSRRICTYNNAGERERSLHDFRASSAGVLIAPSMDRGIDLAGDQCRVVVVAKVPFPYLGDSQVSARMKLPGGQGWYTVQTIRSLVQMTGRAVRSSDDWAVSYILDKQFVSNIWKKSRELLPSWWRESLDMRFPVRELL